VHKNGVVLTAGTHVLKLVVDYGPQSNASWAFNWFTAVGSAAAADCADAGVGYSGGG
jgi:hypothetical protein